jgi:hypothetical protein
LSPRPKPARNSPVAAVLLTSADVDHVLGFYSLREGKCLPIYATPAVQAAVGRLGVNRVLEAFCGVVWHEPPTGHFARLHGKDGRKTHEFGSMKQTRWDKQTFSKKLREVGAVLYHNRHPLHLLMNSGQLNRRAIQVWVANRFYHQVNIPIKDGAIMSNCPRPEVRRIWVHRITDHDGAAAYEGGIVQAQGA